MNLSVEKERDILRFFVKEVLRNKGISRFNHDERLLDLRDHAKRANLPAEEMYTVLQSIMEELFMETFPRKLPSGFNSI